MGKVHDLSFGDLILDETCLFARRNGETIQFTRNERALLLAFSRNPHRLMPRSRLLDEIASPDSDASDRNIDFLVNRLRAKLGDSAKSPKYIATQYGEGYVWIAAPSAVPVATPLMTPIGGLLAIVPAVAQLGDRVNRQMSTLVDRLRDMIAAGVGAGQEVIVVANTGDAAANRARHLLQVSFQAHDGRLDCAASLREMPSKRIVKVFRLALDAANVASFTSEATRVANGVVACLRQALTDASTGLGTPTDQPLEIRLRKASTLLSSSNPAWLEKGEVLSAARSRDPDNADVALQWCLHLFARLVLDPPFDGMSPEARDVLEGEIEATVLDTLPLVEANPLLMLASAKLLYFINRGHLDLAEDLAERAFARTADFAAALPVLGQLRQARGNFAAAVILFDRGIEMAEDGSEFLLHMQVLKCIALLAAGERAALDAATNFAFDTPYCPPDIMVLIRLMLASGDRPLPPALTDALMKAGPDGAHSALAMLYLTSARQHVSDVARGNVMRGLLAHVTKLHGEQVIPSFVRAGVGL